MRYFYLFILFFCFNSFGIFNLKTKEEQEPNINSKKWVFLAQKCHSCVELLVDLEIICNGKKPSPEKVGFLVSGSNPTAMLTKLESFKEAYEMFAGSPNEFHQNYKVMASPSLKSGDKLISGKTAILKFLRKDQDFCSK